MEDEHQVNALIDELAELRGLFAHLSQNNTTLSFDAVLAMCADANEEVQNRDALESIWAGVNHGEGLTPLTFDEFLQFLSFCDPETLKRRNSTKILASTLRHVAIDGAGKTPETLRDLLTSHFRTRPDFESLKSTGLYQSGNNMAKKQLKMEMAKDKIKRTLERRPSMDALEQSGIVMSTTPQQMHLERQLIKDHLKRALESTTRPLMQELKDRGIVLLTSNNNETNKVQFSTATLLNVERNLNRSRLKHALESKNRPDVSELTSKGILVAQTPTVHLMEKNLVKCTLNKKLSSQTNLNELIDKGIFQQNMTA